MKAFIIALLVAAVSAQKGTKEEPFLFTATTQASSPDLHEGIINANNRAFWIGKPAATTCEKDADPKSAICDSNTKNKNTTIFSYVTGEDKFSLDVIMKGGQAVYVDPKDGKLAFTPGGDFEKYPAGALVHGFAKVRTRLLFENKDWVACPVAGSKGVYEIYALSRTKKTGCSGFTFTLAETQPPYNGGPYTAYVYV